jgi:hypothetical protein
MCMKELEIYGLLKPAYITFIRSLTACRGISPHSNTNDKPLFCTLLCPSERVIKRRLLELFHKICHTQPSQMLLPNEIPPNSTLSCHILPKLHFCLPIRAEDHNLRPVHPRHITSYVHRSLSNRSPPLYRPRRRPRIARKACPSTAHGIAECFLLGGRIGQVVG